MAFKADTSFLRFVTMGALGTRRAMSALADAGHQPVELERYSSRNKIWMTKIKRLRLPDLMCVKCGTRFEVRAKTKLQIKMSHTESNPDRRWDTALRDEDVVVFVLCRNDDGLAIAEHLNAFRVADLRASQHQARQGQMKSASEGSEIDLTWPSWTPRLSGEVLSVTHAGCGDQDDRLRVRYQDGSNYTYSHLESKHIYVAPGHAFRGSEQIVASVVPSVAALACPGYQWQPHFDGDSIDIYASIKALATLDATPHLDDVRGLLDHDDPRIVLEAAGVLARYNDDLGIDKLRNTAIAAGEQTAPWAMEAVFIMTEIGEGIGAELLAEVARSAAHAEARAAALWGLGSAVDNLDSIVQAFRDEDGGVVRHAIIAASMRIDDDPNAGATVNDLLSRSNDVASAAAEAIVFAKSPNLSPVLELADAEPPQSDWAFSILVRRGEAEVSHCDQWRNVSERTKNELRRAWYWSSNSRQASHETQEALGWLSVQRL